MRSGLNLLMGLLATGAMAAAGLGSALAAEHVDIGIGKSSSDAPWFVAEARGFFKDEGLDVNLINLDSGAKVIAPLSKGQLDAGSGALSVGFYNAIAQGIKLRIVADRGHVSKDTLYQTIFMRKDLIDSGAFKSLKDLKGKKMAFAAPGVTALSLANETAKKAGIKFEDMTPVYMSFPQQFVALRNKAIDGSFLVEPQATQAEAGGFGVRFMNTQDVYPDEQVTVIFFSDKFAKERPEVAQKLLRAWLRTIRLYNDALKGGKLVGPGSDAIVQTIVKNFHMEPKLVRAMYAPAVNPSGAVNLDSIQKDLTFFQERGWVPKSVSLKGVVDMSFAEKANASLGPYQAKK
jgi:NitT/TauT family transport system substrate-binding protein